MNEKELSFKIAALVKQRPMLRGFTSRDFRRRIGAGWPDWVIMGPGGILYRELKTETGTLSEDQREVGHLLSQHGHDFAVWRTSDLLSGIIESELDTLTIKGT